MSWKAEYVILILFSTVVDYFSAIWMSKTEQEDKRRILLFFSLTVNLGLLFLFKYFNFFSENIRIILESFSISNFAPTFDLLLPVGISFYTFQTLSYTIDVYRRKIEPEKHFGIFAVYVSFFPQLVAGPIERAKNLLPQFREKHNFDFERAIYGLKLMLWGFFLKLVIADKLALTVNSVYNNVENYTGLSLVIATYFFAFQIYCDFAGYSFIAIGSAKIMGFKLMDNFKRPYFAKSISEFWKRWHISLSTWFKDYLYIPLGGNRVKMSRWYLNIFIVFVVSGLWHGAGWTFLIWGALHGLYFILSKSTENIRKLFVESIGLLKFPKLHSLIKMFITFHLVLFAWIFFRANSLSDAIYIITHIFVGLGQKFSNLNLPIGVDGLALMLVFILIMESFHVVQEYIGARKFLISKPIYVRWSAYIALILIILLFGEFTKSEFLYFQF